MRPSSHTFDEKTVRYRRYLKKVTKFLTKNIFLIVATLATWRYLFDIDLWPIKYGDGDGYMRALRIKHWILSPSFFEQPIMESNYPFGEIQHWTRPMDILWLLMMVPFLYLDNLKDIIFLAGTFLAPVLGILSTVVLAYGLRRRFNIYLVLFGCVLFINSITNLNFFSPIRPDHHALMLLLAIYSSSLTMCWLKKRQNRYMRLMGITLALSVFTAAEGTILYALFLSFFLYLYIRKNISLTPAVKASKYFALSLTLFWFLNPPYEGWMFPDNGRLSILYVTAGWFVFAGLWILNLSHLHTARLKFMSLLCITLGFALSLVVIFGTEILHLPIDNQILSSFYNRISECKGITQLPIYKIIPYYTFPFIAIILNIVLLEIVSYKRVLILNLFLGLPLFMISLYSNRFLVYQSTYTIVPFLALIDHLYKISPFAKNKNVDFPGYIWILLAVICIIQILPNVYEKIRVNKPQPKQLISTELCQQVKGIGGTLLTDIFISPRYIWNCDVNTVGTCYHKNKQGIIDTDELLKKEKTVEMIPLILKHQITQILLFDNYDSSYYPLDEANKDKLYWRLIKRENIPPFLEEVPTSLKNARLYEVKI